MKKYIKSSALSSRLRSLYAAIFFLCFVLWYAVEKLYMRSIGFDDALIGVVFAVFSAVILIVEIPSGILADRWSRRGVLMLAAAALLVSTIIGGLSYGPVVYFVSTVLWAVFFALFSGASDSIIYDSMLEENIPTNQFDYYLGRVRMVMSVAAVAGSILGGLVAGYIGLRWTYWLTVPLVLPAFVALCRLREPMLHKAVEKLELRTHFRATLLSVSRSHRALYIFLVLSLIYALIYTVTEFNQLWSIALLAPVLLYGPINALHLATGGIGGYIAGRISVDSRSVMLPTLGLLVASSLGLVLSRNIYVTVAAIAIFCTCLYMINIVYNRYLHETIPSQVRAGATSMVSTVGRLVIIPLSLGIGYLSGTMDIFRASWLIVGLTLILALAILAGLKPYRQQSPL